MAEQQRAVVSVVVPTAARPDDLARLLVGLAAQRGAPPHEVVVVDNAPERSAAPVVGAAPAGPGERRLVVEHRRGVAHARNTGVREARGEVVAFLDDDVVPPPGWLAAITAPLLAGDADVVGGPVRLDPTVAPPAWLDLDGLGGYLTAFDLRRSGGPLGPGDTLVSANLAVRTRWLRTVGGFPGHLGPRGRSHLVGDDAWVVRALREAGARGAWVPDAPVVHALPEERLRPIWFLRRAWSQGRSDRMLDAASLTHRRLGGVLVGLAWLRSELAERRAGGRLDGPTLFHALCDVARTLGFVAESLRDRPPPGTTADAAGRPG